MRNNQRQLEKTHRLVGRRFPNTSCYIHEFRLEKVVIHEFEVLYLQVRLQKFDGKTEVTTTHTVQKKQKQNTNINVI